MSFFVIIPIYAVNSSCGRCGTVASLCHTRRNSGQSLLHTANLRRREFQLAIVLATEKSIALLQEHNLFSSFPGCHRRSIPCHRQPPSTSTFVNLRPRPTLSLVFLQGFSLAQGFSGSWVLGSVQKLGFLMLTILIISQSTPCIL